MLHFIGQTVKFRWQTPLSSQVSLANTLKQLPWQRIILCGILTVLCISIIRDFIPYVMEAFNKPIDYVELERELHEALREDKLYSLQNDAKFRAISQAVPTYEDFRQMVNAAHLKPLDREDMMPSVGVKWNTLAADKTNSQLHNRYFNRPSAIQTSSKAVPKNIHEFRQIWKGLLDHRAKFQWLKDIRFALSDQIFRSEIPPDVLTDCLSTCLESLTFPENNIVVIDILIALSECGRFHLAVAFMSKQDKYLCTELFQALRRTVDATNENVLRTQEEKYLP